MSKLTRKQKAFADTLLNNKKLSAAQAVRLTQNVTTPSSATSRAHELMTNHDVQIYLAAHDYDSQSTIVEMMKQRQDKRLAFNAAQDIQDRLHGTATKKIETHGTLVTLGLSLKDVLDQ